jgi:anaphase-promoting complex subunit 3
MTDRDELPRDQVHERRGEWNSALKMFNQAVSHSQENALVRYHRAKILISMKKYQVCDNLFYQ